MSAYTWTPGVDGRWQVVRSAEDVTSETVLRDILGLRPLAESKTRRTDESWQALQTELQAYQSRQEKNEQRARTVEETLQRMREAAQGTEEQLKRLVAADRTRGEDFKKVRAAHQALVGQLGQVQEQYATCQANNKALRTQIDGWAATSALQTQELDTEKESCTVASQQHQEAVDALQQQLQQLQHKHTACTTENTRLAGSVRTLQDTVANVRQELENVTARNTESANALMESQRLHEASEEHVQGLNARVAELVKENQGSAEALAQCQKALVAHQTLLREQEQQAASAATEATDRITNMEQTYNLRLEKQGEELASDRQKLEQAEELVQKTKGDQEESQKKTAEVQEALSAAQSQVRALRQEVETMKRRTNAMEGQKRDSDRIIQLQDKELASWHRIGSAMAESDSSTSAIAKSWFAKKTGQVKSEPRTWTSDDILRALTTAASRETKAKRAAGQAAAQVATLQAQVASLRSSASSGQDWRRQNQDLKQRLSAWRTRGFATKSWPVQTLEDEISAAEEAFSLATTACDAKYDNAIRRLKGLVSGLQVENKALAAELPVMDTIQGELDTLRETYEKAQQLIRQLRTTTRIDKGKSQAAQDECEQKVTLYQSLVELWRETIFADNDSLLRNLQNNQPSLDVEKREIIGYRASVDRKIKGKVDLVQATEKKLTEATNWLHKWGQLVINLGIADAQSGVPPPYTYVDQTRAKMLKWNQRMKELNRREESLQATLNRWREILNVREEEGTTKHMEELAVLQTEKERDALETSAIRKVAKDLNERTDRKCRVHLKEWRGLLTAKDKKILSDSALKQSKRLSPEAHFSHGSDTYTDQDAVAYLSNILRHTERETLKKAKADLDTLLLIGDIDNRTPTRIFTPSYPRFVDDIRMLLVDKGYSKNVSA